MAELSPPAPDTMRESQQPAGRTVIPWTMVLTFAAVLATADWFWVISLRGAVGATERTRDPFVSWLQGSVLLVPLFVLAMLAALTLAQRWFGPVLRRTRSVVATSLLIVASSTLAGVGALIVSGAYDLRLQLSMLDHMQPMGTQCVGSCQELMKDATLTLQLKALAAGVLILLVTNLLLVVWLVALRGGRLNPAKPAPAEAAGQGERQVSWSPEVQLVLAAALVGTGTVLAVHATADLLDSVAGALLLLMIATAQLAMAHLALTRPGPRTWIAAFAVAVGLPALWLLAHSASNPVAAVLGSPGSIGLAEGATGALEMATMVAAVLLLSGPAWLRRAPASPHAGKLGVVAIVAVTAIGIGGSGLAMFDLGGVDETPVPGNHHALP